MKIRWTPLKKISLISVLFIADRLTKVWAENNLKFSPSKSYWGNFFRFEYAENTGAFLSLGAFLPEQTRFWIFSVAVGVFLLAAIVMLFIDKKMDPLSSFALAIICSGGLGNLYDRILRPNHGVIDFMNMGIGPLRTGIFNIADMAILFGVIILFFKSFKKSAASAN